ncbi:MAG TPA: hypothetical protein VGG65_05580 [Thermoanaerobaculia bacterium]|jgi:hypothetical protein
MNHEDKTPEPKDSERRSIAERRADDRRAHARFLPEKASRSDRRQGERRESPDDRE